jgi:hypothetical protein
VLRVEQIGTHPIALRGAITEAITFHEIAEVDRFASAIERAAQHGI